MEHSSHLAVHRQEEHPTQPLLGIIGGMSWESTQVYYRLINEGVRTQRGGLHSANVLVHSLDFAPIETLQMKGDWDALGALLADSGLRLKQAGATGLLIATNTMHKVAEAVQDATDLPLLHIADATATAIKACGLHRVGLLGTAFTMTQDFYKTRLEQHGLAYDLTVVVPNKAERADVHRIIYDELCQGHIKETSRQRYIEIICRLVKEEKIDGVVLGCTEIGLLIKQADSPVPVFDTTALHARAAVDFLLSAPNHQH